MNLTRYLKEPRIDLDLDAAFDAEEHRATVTSVTEHMAGLLERSEQIVNPTKMRAELLQAQSATPTLLGQGLFLPHVRTLQARRLVMAVGVSRTGLDLPTPDGEPVHLVVALVGPTYDDKVQLQAYKRLSEHLLDERVRETILEAEHPGEVVRAVAR